MSQEAGPSQLFECFLVHVGGHFLPWLIVSSEECEPPPHYQRSALNACYVNGHRSHRPKNRVAEVGEVRSSPIFEPR